ncbi:MAG: STAS domain-containing protein [Acidimicrobiales bacterium]
MTSPQDGLDIVVEDTEQGHVIRVGGELDLASAPELSKVLSEPVGSSTQPVLLDLSGVTFIDSSALRALVVAGRELADSGRKLLIGPRSDTVARVLEVTQLDQQTEAFQVLPEPA